MSLYIEGYLNTLSAKPGETVELYASSNAERVSLRIFREGEPEILMHSEPNLYIGEHSIPDNAWETGPNWPGCWKFSIPPEWTSGVYRVELVGEKNQSPNLLSLDPPTYKYSKISKSQALHCILLVVRAAQPAKKHKILLQLTTNTYIAYNPWGGRSAYAYNSQDNDPSPILSVLRPDYNVFPTWERHFIHWCEREGIGLEYATNYDLHTWQDGFDEYRLILSVGHDEYWSWEMRDNMERFIANGGNAAFFSGNSVMWQVRFMDDGKKMICYKDDYQKDPLYQSDDARLLTVQWTNPLLGRPENHLTGVGAYMGGYHLSHGIYMDGSGAYTVRRDDHWVFSGTGLKNDDEFGGKNTIVGYECDGCLFTMENGFPVPTGKDGTPKDFQILAQAPCRWLDDYVENGFPEEGQATLGLYTRGGTVFTAGTTDWAHGLADDPAVQQITRNVIAKLGS